MVGTPTDDSKSSSPPVIGNEAVTFPSLTTSKSEPQFKVSKRSTLSVGSDSGALETWPAGHTYSRNGRSSSGRSGKWTASSTPSQEKRSSKPRLLAELEKYLETELGSSGGAVSDLPGETRLQVYSEVFDCIIEHFRTYKPLLSSIKREYDVLIGNYASQLQLMFPVQSKLATLKDETLFLLSKMKGEYQSRIRKLEKDLQAQEAASERNQRKVDALAEEIAARQKDIAKLQEEARDAFETNKLLATSLKYYKDMCTNGDDWRAKYEEAMAKLRQTEAALAAVTEAVQSAVSKQTFEDLELDYRKLANQHDDLMAEYNIKEGLYREALVRIAQLGQEKESMRKDWTPRPEWGRYGISQYIPKHPQRHIVKEDADDGDSQDGGPSSQRETKISTGKLISRLFDDMAKMKREIETVKMKLPSDEPYFEGLGASPDVPEYLRYTGKIRNRRLPKGEVEAIIKKVWKSKAALNKQKRSDTLAHALYVFLVKRFGRQDAIAELSYNLIDACKRFSYDPDVDLFYRILIGEMSEEVYLEQMMMVEEFKRHLGRWEANGGDASRMPKDHFFDALRKFFPHKAEESLDALKKALEDDHVGGVVQWKKLFEEDKDGNQPAFTELLRVQFIQERHEFIGDFEQGLLEVDVEHTGELTAAVIRETFQRLDPECAPKDMEAQMSQCFGFIPGDRVPDAQIITLSEFMAAFRFGIIRRHSRRPAQALKPIMSAYQISTASPQTQSSPLRRFSQGYYSAGTTSSIDESDPSAALPASKTRPVLFSPHSLTTPPSTDTDNVYRSHHPP